MIVDIVERQARATPHALALATREHGYTYAKLAGDMRRCANRLRDLGLAPGTVVATQIANPYLHWVVALACRRLGFVNVVLFSHPRPPREIYELGRPELLVADTEPPYAADFQLLKIDQSWTDSMLAGPDEEHPRAPLTLDTPMWILLTSGTTGTPKKVLLTPATVNVYMGSGGLLTGKGESRGPRRILSEFGMASGSGLGAALDAWNTGSALCLKDGALGWYQTLRMFGADTLYVTPHLLRKLLREMPADHAPDPDMTIRVNGGALSRAVALEAMRRLTPDITVFYGSTEMGLVSLARPSELPGREDSAGPVRPGVEVQIVGPAGTPVSHGEMGEVRVKCAAGISGYLDGDAQANANFRDGWFYPGDLGVLSDDGVLRIAGRTDEMLMNCRTLAPQLEAVALVTPGVDDAAAFEAPDDDQLPATWLAYVATETLDLGRLAWNVASWLSHPVRLVPAPAIPRNPMGKVQRNELRHWWETKQAQGDLQYMDAIPHPA